MRNKILGNVIIFLLALNVGYAQNTVWTEDGLGYYEFKTGGIVKLFPKTNEEIIVVKKEQLIPKGDSKALKVQSFEYSTNKNSILLFVNTGKSMALQNPWRLLGNEHKNKCTYASW